jgi:hypothetical protein
VTVAGEHEQVPNLVAQSRRFFCTGQLSSTSLVRHYIPSILISSPLGMLDRPWLETFMMERNTPRLTMPTRDVDLMLAMDRMAANSPEIDIYSLVTKHRHQSAALRNLREGCVWPALLRLLQEPFFGDLRKETFLHWSSRWRAYPVGILSHFFKCSLLAVYGIFAGRLYRSA